MPVKFIFILTILLAVNVFANDGSITCSLSQRVGDSTVHGGDVTVTANRGRGVTYGEYTLFVYTTAICPSGATCTGYEATVFLSNLNHQTVVKAEYTATDAGKIISNRFGPATATCTVN